MTIESIKAKFSSITLSDDLTAILDASKRHSVAMGLDLNDLVSNIIKIVISSLVLLVSVLLLFMLISFHIIIFLWEKNRKLGFIIIFSLLVIGMIICSSIIVKSSNNIKNTFQHTINEIDTDKDAIRRTFHN